MKVELTLDEAQKLYQLIDIAVKASGVSVAAIAAVLVNKVERAAQEEQNAARLAAVQAEEPEAEAA